MHSFSTPTATFNYNSDFSGEVVIYKNEGSIHHSPIYIPACDLLAFVAEYIRMNKISKIESMTARELLEDI